MKKKLNFLWSNYPTASGGKQLTCSVGSGEKGQGAIQPGERKRGIERFVFGVKNKASGNCLGIK